jgi:hypothetical protein
LTDGDRARNLTNLTFEDSLQNAYKMFYLEKEEKEDG